MKRKALLIRILLPAILLLTLANRLFAFPNPVTIIQKEKHILREETFSFVVIGDNQPRGTFGQPAVFRKIISEVNRSDAKFVVHLGDKIQGDRNKEVAREQYKEFKSIIDELKITMYHTAGNHDIRKSKQNEKLHEELFGPLYRSLAWKNSFFIILNTEQVGEEGNITGEQLEWLKRELEKSKKYRDLFVFMHRPLFSALFQGKDHFHFISSEHRNSLAELFKQYGVTAVFAGHEHLYHSGNRDGLQQVISGGGGAPFHFYPKGNFHHYIIVNVKEKEVKIEAVPVSAE